MFLFKLPKGCYNGMVKKTQIRTYSTALRAMSKPFGQIKYPLLTQTQKNPRPNFSLHKRHFANSKKPRKSKKNFAKSLKSKKDKMVVILKKINIASFKRLLYKIWEFLCKIARNTKRYFTDLQYFMKSTYNVSRTVKKEIAHYGKGTIQLIKNILYVPVILRKGVILGVKGLTIGDKKFLSQTLKDILLFFPLMVMVIIPMMEFLIPVVVSVFPNILPSTFRGKKLTRSLMLQTYNRRLEIANRFIDDLKDKGADNPEITKILEKVRSGKQVKTRHLLRAQPFFQQDDIIHWNAERVELVSKYMNLRPGGSEEKQKEKLIDLFDRIKREDPILVQKRVKNLSVREVQEHCRERGMAVANLHDWQLRRNLKLWLALSQRKNVPASMMVHSKMFTMKQQYEDPTHLRTVEKAAEGWTKVKPIKGEEIDILIREVRKAMNDFRRFLHSLDYRVAEFRRWQFIRMKQKILLFNATQMGQEELRDRLVEIVFLKTGIRISVGDVTFFTPDEVRLLLTDRMNFSGKMIKKLSEPNLSVRLKVSIKLEELLTLVFFDYWRYSAFTLLAIILISPIRH